jgi:4'-phosphopantetheinyl transferase
VESELQNGSVDCHRLDLSACDEEDLAVLDRAESERAARFRFDRDRTRYIAAHAWARRHLAGRLGLEPADVPLTTTGNGKPVVDVGAAARVGADPAALTLCFNITHSGAVGYLAIASFSVGIDLELYRPLEDLQPLIDSYCTPREIDDLAALPVEQRCLGFLGVWTRKEAALKAWGTGIGAIPLDRLHVGTAVETIAPLEIPPSSYPGLQLRTIAGIGQVLSVAGATGHPLAVRMVAPPG